VFDATFKYISASLRMSILFGSRIAKTQKANRIPYVCVYGFFLCYQRVTIFLHSI
jgi:hypothetical protein